MAHLRKQIWDNIVTALTGLSTTGKRSASANLSRDDAINHCRSAIADYKVPQYVHVVADFPRTTTNKIQRYLLQQDAMAWFGQEN